MTAIGTLDDAENSNPSTSPSTSPGPPKEPSKEADDALLSSSAGAAAVVAPLTVKQRHSSGDAQLQKAAAGFRSTPATPLKLTQSVLLQFVRKLFAVHSIV